MSSCSSVELVPRSPNTMRRPLPRTQESHQLANRLAVGQHRDGAAGEVGELVAVVDAEVVVDRGEQVLRVERAFGGVFGFGVGGSDDLAHAESSAGDQSGLSLRPVVSAEATVGGRDARSAAELADGDDEDFFVEAALVDVFDQSGEGRVHVFSTQRHPLGHVPSGLRVGMVVPTEIKRHAELRSQRVDGHDSGTRLCQASREQTTLPPEMSAVTVTELRVFASQIESIRDRRAGEKLEGLLMKGFETFGRIEPLPMLIELPREPQAVIQPLTVESTVNR